MIKRLWPATIVLLMFPGFVHAQETPVSQVSVLNVRFENVTRLPAAQKAQLSAAVQLLGAETPSALANAVEREAQAAYADNGYWHTRLKVEIAPTKDLLNDGEDVTIRALEEGPAYKLRQVRWSGVSAFSESELMELLALHPGETLERAQVAEGMDAIRRLYMGTGFLSFVAIPKVEMAEHGGMADLRITVDEGGVFTVHGFDVVGLPPALRAKLLHAWPFQPGDVYRGDSVENFLSANAALLPAPGASDVVCRTVDLSNHTIEFVLDFRPQSLACNPHPELQTTQTLSQLPSNP